MKYLILYSFIFFSLNVFSIVGHDDRFYIHGTKWEKLLNGIVKVGPCTGFVIEGDIIVTVAHCFSENYYWDENDKAISYDLITKDSKIHYKNLKHIEVYFGDGNFDNLDLSEKSHFDELIRGFEVKDLFLAHDLNPFIFYNPIYQKLSLRYSYVQKPRDYAFIKLAQKIPKNIKRFKIFNSDLLKDYEILKHSDTGNLSTAGYHGDTHKADFQKMAHIGCKVRDLKKHQKAWMEYSDCDSYDGANGSPLFYILRHKKTKKIELAVRSIALANYREHFPRQPKEEKASKNNSYRLGRGSHYYFPIEPLLDNTVGRGVGLESISITNHTEFLSDLKKFKKHPSFLKYHKLQKIRKINKNKYLDRKWLANMVQKKSLKELKEFFHKDLPKISEKSEMLFLELFVVHTCARMTSDLSLKWDDSKRLFLSQWNTSIRKKYSQIDTALYPYQSIDQAFFQPGKRAKKFSIKKLSELVDADPDSIPLESSINDKKKAKKLWNMYFKKGLKKP